MGKVGGELLGTSRCENGSYRDAPRKVCLVITLIRLIVRWGVLLTWVLMDGNVTIPALGVPTHLLGIGARRRRRRRRSQWFGRWTGVCSLGIALRTQPFLSTGQFWERRSSISWTFLLEGMAPAKLDTFALQAHLHRSCNPIDSGQNQSPGNEDVPVCNNCWAQGASAGLLATQGPTALSLDALCDRWQSYKLGQRLFSCPSRRRRRQAGHRGKPKGAMGRGKGKDSEWPSN